MTTPQPNELGLNISETDGVTVVVLDDGKVNAFTAQKFAALESVVLAAGSASQPVVIAGRPGFFSAGLDLRVVRGGDAADMRALTDAGDRLFATMRVAPVPIVAACTGHALAGGAVLLMCCDLRLGLAGSYDIGLIEVGVGVALPQLVFDIAAQRLARQHFLRATVLAERYQPDVAVDVGYLDRVVEGDIVAQAVELATTLAALPTPAYHQSKQTFVACADRVGS